MRDKLTTIGEVVGMASITVGVALLSVPLGFIVGGALAVATSVRAAR